MRHLLICLLLSLTAVGGCVTMSENTKEIAATVIYTADTLQNRHIKTIEAFIQSLEAAKADTDSLLKTIREDKDNLQQLKREILSLQADANVGEAIIAYDDKVHSEIFSRLDDTIENVFWPPIVAKQEAYRVKADALKAKTKAHPCKISEDGCTSISLANFHELNEAYLSYSVVAEYVLHLAYEDETKIWQRAVQQYERERGRVKSRAQSFLARQSSDFSISNDALEAELTKVSENLDKKIDRLKTEKEQISLYWAETKGALKQMKDEISKPAVWELVLKGASNQTKSILAGYSGTIKDAVGGVFGDTAGMLVSGLYEKEMNRIADSGASSLNSSIRGMIGDVKTETFKRVDEFLARNNATTN